jgi:hypothetical protein
VRKLIGHIPKERRQLSTWQHVEPTLQACAAGEDPENISVALQIEQADCFVWSKLTLAVL